MAAEIKVGASTLAFFFGPFEDMLEKVPLLPTKHIEIIDDGLHDLDGVRARALADLAKAHGLTYCVHGPFMEANIAAISDGLRAKIMERLKRSMFYAGRLEAEVWVFHPGVAPSIGDPDAPNRYTEIAWNRNLESVRKVLEAAEDLNVRVAIENCCGRRLVKTQAEMQRFLDEVGVKVDLVFDAAHANLYGSPISFYRKFSGRIAYIHASDNYGVKDDHGGIGSGNIDWKKLAGLLRKDGYRGTITCESGENLAKNVEALKQIFC